jgi:Glycosyl transferase family 11
MLTVSLGGGLGNLMWQVAAAETIAAECGRALVLPAATPASPHAPTNYFETVLVNHRAPPVPTGVPVVIAKEPSYQRLPWASWLAPVPPATLVTLEGYFQNYQYIPQGFGASLVLPDRTQPPTAAFLHLRGGDYVHHWLHDVGLTHSGGYYVQAASLFPPDTVFHVFTNDRPWAQSLPWLNQLSVVWEDAGTPEQDLAAMAACPRGGICPNSTFAWWAAWLGHDRWPDATYVLPRTWFNTPGFYVDGYFFPGSKVL